jgi:hypothetical protein
MDANQWAKQKAEEVKAKRDREHAENLVRLAEDKKRVEAGPGLWDDVVRSIYARAKSFNESLGENAINVHPADSSATKIIAQHLMTQISAEFKHLQIRCMLISTSAEYDIRAMNGQATFVTGRRSIERAITPDEIAEEFLADIIKNI